MKNIFEIIKNLNDQIELLVDAKGVMKCALIVKIYQLIQSISEEVEKNEEIYKQEKLIMEARIKDLEEAIASMKAERAE